MATEAFTKNLTSLSSGVIVKTGPCDRLTDGSRVEAKKQSTAIRMEFLWQDTELDIVAYTFTRGYVRMNFPEEMEW